MMEPRRKSTQRGASIVHWLIALGALLGFGTLAVDLNNVYVSTAELQNAADAGALEGARLLYNADGSINTGANTAATDAATANRSQGVAVEVDSVIRGHWQFLASSVDSNGIERGGRFYANSHTVTSPLFNGGDFREVIDRTTSSIVPLDASGCASNPATYVARELNDDPCDINAIQVVVKRKSTPVQSFFGNILGFVDGYQTTASAVAYVGFAGSINPGEIDAPIALCEDRLRDSAGNLSCSVGRYAPSAETSDDQETAKWTDLTQPEGACGSADSSTMSNLINNHMSDCGVGNDGILNNERLVLGEITTTTNGLQASTFTDFYNCWKNNPSLDTDSPPDGWPDKPWKLSLPVINCEDFSPGACNPLIGAVTIRVLWVVNSQPDSQIDANAPIKMTGVVPFADWDGSGISDGQDRWDSFATNFDLRKDAAAGIAVCHPPGASVPASKCDGYKQKTVYFAPDCDLAQLGGTGGANFGIRAEVPVLVF